MISHEAEQRIQTLCLTILSIIAIGVALLWLRPVMIPFILAVFFTLILNPLIDIQLKYFKIPRIIAILTTLVIGITILMVIGTLISSSLQQMASNADSYQVKLENMINQISTKLEDQPFGDVAKTNMRTFLEDLSNKIGGVLVSTINAIFGVLKQGVLVFIFVLFLLLGQKRGQPTENADFIEGKKRIERYISTKFAISAITGVSVGLILMLFGIDLALVFGLFAFILNFIPSVGSIIATLLPLPIVLVTPDISPLVATLAIGIPGIIQFAIGNVIEPKIMGESLDLHPVAILMALIFWGMIWGIVGMFMAVPLTAIMKIIFDKSEVTQPISNLLSGRID